MTLKIDLTPEEEARLQQVAARHGLVMGDYIRTLIEQDAQNDMPVPKGRRKAARRSVGVESGMAAQVHAADTGGTEAQTGTDVSGTDKPKTGAELVAYLERAGVFGTFADRGDSQEFARELRRQAERRQ